MLTKIILIILILFSFTFSQSTITFASFNIRIFSDNSRDDEELEQICEQLKDYDFIAIQELRDERIMERTIEMLDDEFNKEYSYVISEAVGTTRHKERYAFLYRSDRIDYNDFSDSYPDVGDNFIREPFYASFMSSNFDFTVITIHSIYGNTKEERRAEARLLDEVYSYVQNENGDEQDVILCGDFNLSASDAAFDDLRNIYAMQELISGGTSIKDKEYDNIWINPTFTTEYNNQAGIDKFDETDFNNEDRVASLAVSDHRPIWAKFVTSNPDDDGVSPDNTPSGTLLNVNTASSNELISLPGIGPVIASRIITARQNQPFENIQDLQDRVSGIGPVLAERLSSLVTF